ncbi:uncharacterized protein [Notamacropus eugenii]|uniref:uncharacterized protein isoform X1 n=1 Tax=Notamacropus eugenii TaxID=9315 RepID=UPI003B683B7C
MWQQSISPELRRAHEAVAQQSTVQASEDHGELLLQIQGRGGDGTRSRRAGSAAGTPRRAGQGLHIRLADLSRRAVPSSSYPGQDGEQSHQRGSGSVSAPDAPRVQRASSLVPQAAGHGQSGRCAHRGRRRGLRRQWRLQRSPQELLEEEAAALHTPALPHQPATPRAGRGPGALRRRTAGHPHSGRRPPRHAARARSASGRAGGAVRGGVSGGGNLERAPLPLYPVPGVLELVLWQFDSILDPNPSPPPSPAPARPPSPAPSPNPSPYPWPFVDPFP